MQVIGRLTLLLLLKMGVFQPKSDHVLKKTTLTYHFISLGEGGWGGGLVLKTMFKQIAVVKISNYVPLLGGVSGGHSGKTENTTV